MNDDRALWADWPGDDIETLPVVEIIDGERSESSLRWNHSLDERCEAEAYRLGVMAQTLPRALAADALIEAHAVALARRYPQYAGKEMRIAQATRRFVVKGHRTAFEQGDWMLVETTPYQSLGETHWSAHSWRTGNMTAIEAGDFAFAPWI